MSRYVEPIKEGAVEIRFAESEGKQRITFIIDFGKTDLNPDEASDIFNSIVAILRTRLDVELSKCA